MFSPKVKIQLFVVHVTCKQARGGFGVFYSCRYLGSGRNRRRVVGVFYSDRKVVGRLRRFKASRGPCRTPRGSGHSCPPWHGRHNYWPVEHASCVQPTSQSFQWGRWEPAAVPEGPCRGNLGEANGQDQERFCFRGRFFRRFIANKTETVVICSILCSSNITLF